MSDNRMESLWESFTDDYHVPDFIFFDGEAPMYYGDDNMLIEIWKDIHNKWVEYINKE